MTRNQSLLLVLIVAVVVAAITRLLPHPPNFSPLVAAALFSGAVITDRRLALLVPLAAMLLSDLVLGFHTTMAFVYLALALVVGVGSLLGKRRAPLLLGGVGVAGALVFFVVSNAGVWLQGSLYAHSLAGLIDCYLLALPFFPSTLLATLLYGALLFGAEQLLGKSLRPLQA